MNFINFAYALLAQAESGTAEGASGNGMMSMIIMIALIFFVMWLFIIRPQQVQQKKYEQMVNSLKIGDKVIVRNGFKASITNIVRNKDNEIIEFQLLLNSSNNVKVICEPWGIYCLDTTEEDNDKDKDKDKEKDKK